MKVKGILFILFFTLSFFAFGGGVSAKEESVNLHFFYSEVCPHCAHEKTFLDKFSSENEFVKVYSYDVSTPEAIRKVVHAENVLNFKHRGVPLLIIGEKHIVGWGGDETTGVLVASLVDDCVKNGYVDIFEENHESSGIAKAREKTGENKGDTAQTEISLPFFGKVDLKAFSLPLLTLVIGFLDGFNPCAMWVLLFLISVLLGVKDIKRRWFIGVLFLVFSAGVYFIFLAAWLNFFMFLKYVVLVRYVIGVFAIGVGIYFLKKFMSKETGCQVVSETKRERIFSKIKNIIVEKNMFMVVIGTLTLAFSVNLIELACSAGLPAIYTNILSGYELSVWNYYLYLTFYIIIFLIDDLIVLFIALTTLRVVGVEGKYEKISKLVGGIVILVLGLLMVFKPELLSFS